eukprot:scaffold4151_cov137-Skeletonema_menzelii.AAC.6
MSKILPQKRSGAMDTTRPDPPTNSNSSSQRYTKLLSVLTKSLQQSRDKVESTGPHLIKEIYGDMTSLFTTGEENDDGVTQLVDLLLGKLDTVHDRFNIDKSSSNNQTKLESILEQYQIQQLVQRVELAIEQVERDEKNFEQEEAADKQSAEEAVRKAQTLRVNSVTGKLRKVNADEFVGYHSNKKKEEYLDMLQKELEEVTRENEEMEGALKETWEEWQKNLVDVKGALGLLQQLGSVGEEEEGPRDP